MVVIRLIKELGKFSGTPADAGWSHAPPQSGSPEELGPPTKCCEAFRVCKSTKQTSRKVFRHTCRRRMEPGAAIEIGILRSFQGLQID